MSRRLLVLVLLSSAAVGTSALHGMTHLASQEQAIGRPNRVGEGRVTLVEDNRDIIVKVSRPYMQFSIMD